MDREYDADPSGGYLAHLQLKRERERSLLDKLRGVPTCQRCRRWPSDVTAALFFTEVQHFTSIKS